MREGHISDCFYHYVHLVLSGREIPLLQGLTDFAHQVTVVPKVSIVAFSIFGV
jgi:hypothetical protein